jgi:nucleoside-diphosphate-sugar epimerase
MSSSKTSAIPASVDKFPLPTAKIGTALVLGLTGAIGGAVAAALARRGYRVRALTRHAATRTNHFGHHVDWIDGDAVDRDAVIRAAYGADLIVHAVNPPNYSNWREIGLPMLNNTVDAAERSGATILFPANVYVFSKNTPDLVDEAVVPSPTTRKGQVRLEMEELLANAARTRDVRVIAVRAGDFFGKGVVNSWFSQALVKNGPDAKSIQLLSRPGVGHSWAYVPDLAETFGRLVDIRAKLAPYEMVHFAGHYDDTANPFAEAISRAISRPDLKTKAFPWFSVYLGAPFVPFLREVIEMIWLWKHPLKLDNSKLVSLIGDEPHTPLDLAIAASLDEPIAHGHAKPRISPGKVIAA